MFQTNQVYVFELHIIILYIIFSYSYWLRNTHTLDFIHIKSALKGNFNVHMRNDQNKQRQSQCTREYLF